MIIISFGASLIIGAIFTFASSLDIVMFLSDISKMESSMNPDQLVSYPTSNIHYFAFISAALAKQQLIFLPIFAILGVLVIIRGVFINPLESVRQQLTQTLQELKNEEERKAYKILKGREVASLSQEEIRQYTETKRDVGILRNTLVNFISGLRTHEINSSQNEN